MNKKILLTLVIIAIIFVGLIGWIWFKNSGYWYFNYYILHKGPPPNYCDPGPCGNYMSGVVEIKFSTALSFSDENKFLQSMNLQLMQSSSYRATQTLLLHSSNKSAVQELQVDIQQLESSGVIKKLFFYNRFGVYGCTIQCECHMLIKS